MHSGLAPLPTGSRQGGSYYCICDSPRFDVDFYGRVFYPDAPGFAIGVLDTNGNPIRGIGRAAWHEHIGPGNRPAAGDLPLAWGAYVGVSERQYI